MPKVVLTARGGLRHEGKRYSKGDALTVSDSFLAQHPTRFTVVTEPKRKPRKKVEPAPEPKVEAPKIEVSSNGDNTGDHSGL